MAKKVEEKKEEKVEVDEVEKKAGILRRIGSSIARCGRAGWKILAYIGSAITRNHGISRFGFFRKLGIIGLGLVALVFMTVCSPLLVIGAGAEIGIEKLAKGGEECESSEESEKKPEQSEQG